MVHVEEARAGYAARITNLLDRRNALDKATAQQYLEAGSFEVRLSWPTATHVVIEDGAILGVEDNTDPNRPAAVWINSDSAWLAPGAPRFPTLGESSAALATALRLDAAIGVHVSEKRFKIALCDWQPAPTVTLKMNHTDISNILEDWENGGGTRLELEDGTVILVVHELPCRWTDCDDVTDHDPNDPAADAFAGYCDEHRTVVRCATAAVKARKEHREYCDDCQTGGNCPDAGRKASGDGVKACPHGDGDWISCEHQAEQDGIELP